MLFPSSQHFFLQKLLFISFLFSTHLIFGQSEYIADVQTYTIEEGLSHHVINGIVKDQRGVIWIATRYGLNRFDGREFKVYYIEDGLASNDVGVLYGDGAVLWCFHRPNAQYELTLFHILEEKPIDVKSHMGKELPFALSEIESVFVVGNRLFFQLLAEKGGDLFSYSSLNGFKKIPFLKKGETILAITPNGDYWMHRKEERLVYIRQLNQKGIELNSVRINPTSFRKNYILNFLKVDQDNSTWFSYRGLYENDNGFLKITSDGKILQVAPISVVSKGDISSIDLTYVPAFDVLWKGGEDFQGLLSADGDLLYEASNFIGRPDLIDDNIIWQSNEHGLYQIELKKNAFHTFFEGYPMRSICKIDSIIFFHASSKFYSAKKDLSKAKLLSPDFGFSLLKSRDGNIWLNIGGRLAQYQPESDRLEFILTEHLNSEIWSYWESHENKLYYPSGKSLYCFDLGTNSSSKVSFNEFEGLNDILIYHFFENKDGNLLLSTTEGLLELKPGKGIVARYWSGGEGKYKLPCDEFRHLFYDQSDETFWLASRGEGLIHWNPEKQSSESYSFNNVKTNTVHAVYADDYGFLWLSTDNGLVQFNKESKGFKIYYTEDGTSSNEFNRISHYKAMDGTLYFGGISGMTIFHPKDFIDNIGKDSEVSISIIELQQYLNEKDDIENLTADFYKNQNINLNPGDRFFNLRLALSQSQYSAKAIYYFRLQDVDKNWTITKNNQIPISGLPYGKHNLQIKALLYDGTFSKILEIPVFVGKPFYLTWWFFTFLLSSLLILTIAIIQWRTKRLRVQKIILEEEVKKRTNRIEQDKKVIEEQAEELRALDATKSRFFANVSHELRTPITLIQGPIESIMKRQKVDNRDLSLLSKAKQNSINLLGLVNEILDLTRLDAQKIELDESKVVLYTFMRRIISSFQSIADHKRIELLFAYHPPKELQIKLDQKKFEKILNNLLSNAFKFTPKGGQISISIEDRSKNLCLIVKDNGRGIPPEDVPNIFNRFYQSSLNNKAEGGLGIGLALSIEFIKLMQGNIWVESSLTGENKGSTFFVEFPKKEVMGMLSTEEKLALNGVEAALFGFEPQAKSLVDLKSTDDSSGESQASILLVEDNSDLRDYIQFLLEPYYHVVTAENGEEGLERLTLNRPPSLIISDVMMPIMDGFEFLEKLKSNAKWRNIPVIMLTARAELRDKLKALRIGVDDYMVKPFKEEELLVRIENLLANYEERQTYWQLESGTISKENGTVPKPNEFTISEKDQEWLRALEALALKEMNNSIFSIDYLSDLLSINRNDFYKKVKSLTGLTPNQYLRAIRLQKAKELLESGTCQSVKEVGQKVGFQKTDYFSNLYKKEYGKAPSAYFF